MGDLTANKFLYKPSIGATGTAEKLSFDAGLDQVDARLGIQVCLGDPNFQFSEIPLYKDGIQDDAPHFAAFLGKIGTEHTNIVIPKGTYKLNADVTFPANAFVKMQKGAVLAPGTVACTGTISNADSAATGTITVTSGTSKVTGSGTNFWSVRPGQWITTNGGQRRQVRKVVSSLEMYVWQDWSSSESAVSWTMGSYLVNGSGTAFASQLRVGDFVYYGGTSLVVTKVVNNTQLWAAEIPAATFSGQSFSRSVRAVIQGGFEAGMHQVFSGNGICQFEGMVDFVRPEWWGAQAGDSDADAAANSAAFEKAVYCQSFGGTAAGAPIQLSRGVYRLNRRVPLASNTYLRGQWLNYTYSRGSVLYPASAYSSPALLMDIFAHPGDASYNYTGPKIENLKIDTGERNFNGKPVNGIELTVSKQAHVTGNMFRNCYGNNLMLAGSASIAIIEGNYFDALGNAIWCPGYDSIITKNHISFGNNVVTNGTFATDTGWTKGANWTIAGHVATHTLGSTETLSQEPASSWTGLKFIREGESYSVWYAVSGCTAGSVTVSIGGHAGTARNADGTYVEFFTVTNGNNNTIAFTPTADFNGSLDNVKIHYGVGVFLGGSPNMVTNNFLWGDRGSDACIAHYCADAIIANNDMVTADYGIRLGSASGKLLTNNQFRGNRAYGLYFPSGNTAAQQIRGNYFETGLGITPLAAIHCPAAATFSGAVVTDNYFQTASFPAYLELGASSSSHPLFKDNVGLDDQGLITISGATPTVVAGSRFITNNPGATTITDLTRGAVGKEVTIITGDARTTINNGGNFKLSANFPAPPVGSSITLIKSSSGAWVEKSRSITP